MKKLICLFAIAGFSSSLFTAHAQLFGGGAGSSGPNISSAMKKLFGDNPTFTANAEVQVKGSARDMNLPGKITYAGGKFRVETDMSQLKGGKEVAGVAQQTKQTGMDKMVIISLPDKKLSYLIYPGLKAYAETPAESQDAAKTATGSELKITELGKETLEGHPCVKNKVETTDNEGKLHAFTVWNATDLKKFPVKIEASEDKATTTVMFKDVKFDQPAASQFEPPANYKKYDNMMAMLQQEMMKRSGNAQPAPKR